MSVSGQYMAANKQTRTCIMKLFFLSPKAETSKKYKQNQPQNTFSSDQTLSFNKNWPEKVHCLFNLIIPTIFQQSSLTYHTVTVLNYFFISSQTNRSSRIQILGHGFKIKMDTVGKQIGVKMLKVIQDLI